MNKKNKILKIMINFSWILFIIPILLVIISKNNKTHLNIHPQIYNVTVLLSLLFIFIISIINLIKKNWAAGLSGCFTFFIIITVIVIWFFLLSMFNFIFPADENFTDNLYIPDNIEISEPSAWNKNTFEDSFTKEILTELKREGNEDSTVKGEIHLLKEKLENNREQLIYYFAANPYWKLSKKNGSFNAVRRMTRNNQLKYSLNGYYTKHDLTNFNDAVPYFQMRTKFGFKFKKKNIFSNNTTVFKNNESKNVKLTTGNNSNESNIVIKSDDLYLEIFEQSKYKERIITKKIISLLNNELDKLKNDNAKTVLPEKSIIRGNPEIILHHSYQPGIYDSEIWINPGEPGYIYLKAFEVTKNIPLSEYELKNATIEYTGWSNNSEELFYSNSNFTVYEGVWGKPYAARFEVWFVPGNGNNERKLLEKNFKIEGWMR